MESDPLLPLKQPATTIDEEEEDADNDEDQDEVDEANSVARKDFYKQSIQIIVATSRIFVAGVSVLLFSKYDIFSIQSWLYWTIVILVVIVGIFLALISHGLYLWKRGELPLQRDDELLDDYEQQQQDENGALTQYYDDMDVCYTTSTDGRRVIEYCIWGSDQADATVVVYCHSSNGTGKHLNAFLFPHEVLVELNVKAISPSYPGHGGSDMDLQRRIATWPLTDLEPILYDEGVQEFMVIGTSYGTAHAMATAACFPPTRCIAMGLNVPYLPEPICREFQFHTDADYVLNEAQLQKPWILLPILSTMSVLIQPILPSATAAIPEGRKAKVENPQLLEALAEDVQRSFLRGVNGQVYEMLNADTNQHWQDPKSIQTPLVAVWYADDDSACPPAHGKWLADIFTKSTTTVECHVRHESKGLGHFTYMGQEDRDTAVMTTTLLELYTRHKDKLVGKAFTS